MDVRAIRAWVGVHEGIRPTVGAALVAVASILCAGSALDSFLIVEFAQAVPITLLLPLAAALLIGVSASNASTDFASAAPRRLRWWRATWVVGLSLLYTLAANASCLVGECQGAVVTRNVVLFAALAVLGVTAFGSTVGWAPLILYAICFLFFGQRPYGEQDPVRSWAMPLAQDFSTAQAGVCLLVAALAVGVYAKWGASNTDTRLRGIHVE